MRRPTKRCSRQAARECAGSVAMGRIRVEEFLREFTRWASGQGDIQAVALVGSYARGTATETSDVDLVVVANQPQLYLKERTWTYAFGEVVNQRVEEYGRLISLRVQYAKGLEVEYGLTDPGWAEVLSTRARARSFPAE